MPGDITNFRLSTKANEVAEELKETGRFEDVLDVVKFGLSYTLKNHFDEISPGEYQMPDQNGSNYSVGSLDNDGQFRTLLLSLYPGTDTPYIYARALITFGLLKIGDRLHNEGFKSINALM